MTSPRISDGAKARGPKSRVGSVTGRTGKKSLEPAAVAKFDLLAKAGLVDRPEPRDLVEGEPSGPQGVVASKRADPAPSARCSPCWVTSRAVVSGGHLPSSAVGAAHQAVERAEVQIDLGAAGHGKAEVSWPSRAGRGSGRRAERRGCRHRRARRRPSAATCSNGTGVVAVRGGDDE